MVLPLVCSVKLLFT
ncbi:hypothetical protein RDABS01_002250 [Bienertia sinuspersici]